MANVRSPNNIDFDELAEKYDNISGSDIANAVLMAAFKAARQKANIVDKSLIFEAIESTLASRNANCENAPGGTLKFPNPQFPPTFATS